MKLGFSLFESLVYISCSTFAITLFFIMLQRFYTNIKASTNNIAHFLEVINCLDVIRRDILKVSANNLVLTKEHSLLLKFDTQLCSLTLKSGRLYRYSGNYSFDQKKWIKKGTSLIAQNIKSISFDQINQSLKIQIYFHCNLKDKLLELISAFRVGQLI